MGKQPRLKRHTPGHLLPIPIRGEQDRLKIRHGSILPNQVSPIARLGSRSQVAITERPDRILSNPLRDLGMINKVIHLGRQITPLLIDFDIICFRARRHQSSVVCLAPDERVRDHHAAAVQQVLAAAGEAAALGVREEHVAAVVLDREEVVPDVGFVVPVDDADASPAAAERGFEELAAHGRVGGQTAAPDELLLLFLEAQARDHGAVRCCLAVVEGCDAAADFVVRSDLDLWPGPVAEVRHQPDGVVAVALGV